MPMIDIIRLAQASQNFHIQEDFEFINLDDLSAEDIKEHGSFPDVMEIWAKVRIKYEGTVPESYKILNLAIGDWVEAHLGQLTDVIHKELKEHFAENYPDSDMTDLDEVDNTAIWTDQLDYMPDVEESKKSIEIDVELVLHGEPMND